MDRIFFPPSYKKSLLQGFKNTTLRVNEEQGKYIVGKTYLAYSYAGRNWHIRIKIQEITTVYAKQLLDYGIPKKAANAITKLKGISSNSKVDIIKFKML